MLYCSGCGKEVADEASFCANCGRSLKEPSKTETAVTATAEQPVKQAEHNQSKAAIGVLLGLLVVVGSLIMLCLNWVVGLILMLVLAVVGLIIGMCLYPENTVARKTFVKGWGITIAVTTGITIFIVVIMLVIGLSIINSL